MKIIITIKTKKSTHTHKTQPPNTPNRCAQNTLRWGQHKSSPRLAPPHIDHMPAKLHHSHGQFWSHHLPPAWQPYSWYVMCCITAALNIKMCTCHTNVYPRPQPQVTSADTHATTNPLATSTAHTPLSAHTSPPHSPSTHIPPPHLFWTPHSSAKNAHYHHHNVEQYLPSTKLTTPNQINSSCTSTPHPSLP